MRNRLAILWAAVLAFAVVGCESDEGTECVSTDAQACLACTDTTGNFGCEQGRLPLTWVSQALDGHALTMTVTYAGGCGRHEFRAWWDGRTLSSYPGIAQIKLNHYACDEHCTDTVTDTVTLDLSALDESVAPAPAILRVEIYAAAGGMLGSRFDYTEPDSPASLPEDAIPLIPECGGIDIP